MSVSNEYELYDLEAVNGTLVTLLKALLGPTVQVNPEAAPDSNKTPRVDMILRTEQRTDHRWTGNRSVAGNTADLPRNAWDFTIAAAVSTNRETNGQVRREIISKVRWQLQGFKLRAGFTPAASPLYVIVDSWEVPVELTVDVPGNLDTTTLNFRGLFAIRNSAWPA